VCYFDVVASTFGVCVVKFKVQSLGSEMHVSFVLEAAARSSLKQLFNFITPKSDQYSNMAWLQLSEESKVSVIHPRAMESPILMRVQERIARVLDFSRAAVH
jgi:hypothetical protein